MSSYREIFVTDINCDVCKTCKPWILCVCYTCQGQWWCRTSLATRWCDNCLNEERSVARILVVTGHEVEESDKYFCDRADWKRLTNQRAKTVLVSGFECSRSNLVPAIWTIPNAEWEKTKARCLRRFGKKRQKKSGYPVSRSFKLLPNNCRRRTSSPY